MDQVDSHEGGNRLSQRLAVERVADQFDQWPDVHWMW